MLVHSYSRFSDPSQSAGDSLRRQQQQAADFCKRKGWKLSDLRFADLGRSAYKANKQRALDEFLRAIDDGRVKPGECLLVEAVDRLSRKGIRQTQNLVNRILDAGVSIAILTPFEKIYSPGSTDNDIGFAVELAAFAFQAATYSKNLSYRLKEYGQKQRKRRADGENVRVSPVAPTWLEWERKANRYKTKPEATKAVRYIFKRTIDGIGRKQLVREMNEKFPPITLGTRKNARAWNQVFIGQIIKGRAVLGEFASTVTGEVFPDYYPRVIDDETWKAANLASSRRKGVRGRSTQRVNVFSGLLFHAGDGSPCSIYSTSHFYPRLKVRKFNRRYSSAMAKENETGADRSTFLVDKLEDLIFGILPKLDLRPSRANPRLELEHQRESLRADIAELQGQITGRKAAAAVLAGPLVDLQEKLETVERELAAMASSSVAPSKEYRAELARMRRGTPEERLLLSQRLALIVKRIWLLPAKTGPHRASVVVGLVEIEFCDGCRARLIEIDGAEPFWLPVSGPTLRERVEAGWRLDLGLYAQACELWGKENPTPKDQAKLKAFIADFWGEDGNPKPKGQKPMAKRPNRKQSRKS